MLDLTKNRYSSQWVAENDGDRFGFVKPSLSPDVDLALSGDMDWDIDFKTVEDAKAYIGRVIPRLEKQKERANLEVKRTLGRDKNWVKQFESLKQGIEALKQVKIK